MVQDRTIISISRAQFSLPVILFFLIEATASVTES